MKRMIQGLALCMWGVCANAADYYNSKVTGVGMGDNDTSLRFTIDTAPHTVFTTANYSGDKKQLAAIILTAYTTQSNVFLIRSDETTNSQPPRHYATVHIFSVGTYVFD